MDVNAGKFRRSKGSSQEILSDILKRLDALEGKKKPTTKKKPTPKRKAKK